MEEKNKQVNTKNIVALAIFAVAFIALWILQSKTTGKLNETAVAASNAFEGLVQRYGMGPDSKSVSGPLEGLKHVNNNFINGVIGQAQIFVCVAVTLITGKAGFIASSGISAVFATYSLVYTVIIKGQSRAIAGVAIYVSIVIIVGIVYYYISKTSKMHADLTESYEQVIENNRLIKEKDEVLSYLAYYDRLTQMPNRQLFMETLEDNAKNGVDCYVLYVDIDNFREVNEGYGHSTGDELLVEYAKRMEAIARENDFVAKIGGDEFGVIFLAGSTNQDVINCVAAIQEAFRDPVTIRGDKFSLTASYGAAHFPADARSAEDVFRCAETAMFASKANGKNQLSFFSKGV